MRILILALTVAFSASHAAADISWQADRMAPGSIMVMEDSQGRLTHVKRGTEAGQHVFDLFDGEGRAARYVGSYTVNGRGDVTSTVAADGAVTRFTPHRCSRTPGKCQFTITHADGFVEPRTRVTRPTASGLAWQEYGLDGLIAEGALELDRIGAAKKGWKKDRRGKGKTRTRRVMIALR